MSLFEDFTTYLRSLTLDDWSHKVTDLWDVKDVLAHLVGWEEADPEIIKKTWKTKQPPWWDLTDQFDEFNQKQIDRYRDFSPEQLLIEFEKNRTNVRSVIQEIGEEQLRTRLDLFGWLFDDSKQSHIAHHFSQIKSVLKK